MQSFCKAAFLILFTLLLPVGMTAQNPMGGSNWKETKVTLRVSDEPLGFVLQKVAKAAGATLELQDVAIVGINEPTTLNVTDMPLDKVLGRLIGNQNIRIRYEYGRQIVIEADKSQPAVQEVEKNSYIVNGQVITGDTNEPAVGATIVITDGTSKTGGTMLVGCITDADGKFSLRVGRKQSIRIAYIGYETVSHQITRSENNLKITLKADALNLGEVVVNGISRRNKNSFTGGYVTVDGDKLRQINPNNFLQGLQYFDPSFKIIENNNSGSDPNGEMQFQIRGDQSLGSTRDMNSMDLMLDNVSKRPNTPLFVLDGFIVSMSRIMELDPQRVANVTILKDAAATAIYGSKASNGVVVIETKVAPDGALQVNYNGGMTLSTPDLTGYNMMNASEKLQAEWMAGLYDPSNPTQMNKYNEYKRNVLAGVDTYWLSKPLRTALQNRHTLSVGGGTNLFRYSLDLNASFVPGVMKGSENDTKSVNFAMTYHKENLTVGATINLSENNGENSPYGSYSNYTSINPYYLEKNASGGYDKELDNHFGTIITNPLYNANVGIKDQTRNLTITTGLNLEYMILKNLRLTESLSYVRGMARTEKFLPSDHTSFATETDLTKRGSYTKNTGEMTSWSSNLGINYNLNIGKHLLSMFGNWTVNEDRSNYVNLYATGYPDKHMDDFIFGNTMPNNPTGTEAISREMGLIGQVSYSYDNKYSFDFNINSENSSRYSDHSLTPFWSTGVRWNAHREKFLQGYVSNLVLRATYGITGAQDYDPYQAIEFYTFSNTMKYYKSFGVLGAVLAGLNNPDLKWAKTDNFSLGLDLGFWDNRVNISFNYYDNITRQMLTDYDLAPSTGFSSQTINAGELQNKGFDVMLNVIAYQNIKKGIYWTISANANHNSNKIRKISDYLRKVNEEALASTTAPIPVLQEGHSTTTLYTVRSLGIDPVTGKEVYLTRDMHPTFTWDSADKVPVGDTNPDVSGTFSTALNWKEFSLSLGFTYKWGGITYNSTLVDKIENSNIAYNLDRRAMTERWQQPGDVVRYKKFSTYGAETPQSSRFIMKDNELKLGTLNVGYRFNYEKFKWLNTLSINTLALNFTTNDLFRISTIKMERGLGYPFARTYTLSLSVIFK